MKKLFERLANPIRSEPRLTLAAFGKHPGWDDHIPGIGLTTDTLARLKQTLYVEGIGRQIDSGAWEKLEVDKRYDNFDHSFLWLWPDRLVVGLLWSSTDRKGRSKYPMVLCVEGQNVSPAFMVKAVMPGLSRLRDACRNTRSPEEVQRLCAAAQEQLGRLLAAPAASEFAGFGPPEQRREFVDHPDNGPERLGLLRLLHELSLVPSLVNSRANNADSPEARASEHLRLPCAARSPEDSLLLWAGLLVCAVADNIPVLILSRAGETYLETVVGEPDPGDFFCLQTTPAAQPLVTRIPYQLSPNASEELQAVVARFLDAKPGTPAPVAKSVPSPAPAATPSGQAQDSPGRRHTTLVWAGLAVLLLAAAAVAVLLSRGGSHRNAAPQKSSPASSPTPAPPSTNTPAAAIDLGKAALPAGSYERFTNEAARAIQAGDYSNGLTKANLALEVNPNDPIARELKRKAGEALLIAGEIGKNSELIQGLARARAADKAEDWDLASREYERGAQLASETRDNAAMAEAKTALEFTSAMAAAQRAFKSADFRTAVGQAEKALRLRPLSAGAAKVKAAAQAGVGEQDAAAKRLAQFQAATNAAGDALRRNDLTNALSQLDKALALEGGDPGARALRRTVQDAMAAQLQATRKQKLASDLQTARSLFAKGDYTGALAVCATQPEASELKAIAASVREEQLALESAQKDLAGGDYAAVRRLQTGSLGAKAGFATIIAQAAKEEEQLSSLNAARQTNGWEVVQQRVSSSEFSAVRSKKPFLEVSAWADQQAKVATAAAPASLAQLDEALEILLVRYNVLKPEAPELTSAKARNEKPVTGTIAVSSKQRIQQIIDRLEQEYARGGWLEQNNRKRNLENLKDNLKYRY